MPRMDKLSSYRTTVSSNEARDVVVTYVATPIVTFNAESVTLRSGGYQTVTTKQKMNQAANQFGLGYSVYQHKGEWFVSVWSDVGRNAYDLPFVDGMSFKRASS